MHTSRSITPVAVAVGALFTLAVIVTAWSGHTAVAVLVGLNGVLLTSYFVRHRMRMRLIYGRRPHGGEDQPGQPRPTDTAAAGHPLPQVRPRPETVDRP